MIEKVGPTIYKGESIYKTGAAGGGGGGGGNVLLSTLCNNIVDGVDVPIIGEPSENLSTFNYTNLNPGFTVNCNSLAVDYSGDVKLYTGSTNKENFDSSFIFSFSRASSYRTYGFRLGPLILLMGDNYTNPSFAADALSFVMPSISSGVTVHTNSSFERRSNGQLYVKIGSYTQNKIYNVRFTINDTIIKGVELVTGAYFYIDRQYYTGNYQTILKFGPLSTEKRNEQSANIYGLDIFKL